MSKNRGYMVGAARKAAGMACKVCGSPIPNDKMLLAIARRARRLASTMQDVDGEQALRIFADLLDEKLQPPADGFGRAWHAHHVEAEEGEAHDR